MAPRILSVLAAALFAVACTTTTPPTSPDLQAFAASFAAPSRPASRPASRLQRDDPELPVEGDRTVSVGLGTTSDPASILVNGAVDFWQSDRLAIGPMLQIGVDDNTGVVAPSFGAKFVFPIERRDDNPLFMPFVQGGAGACYLRKDRRGDDDDFGLMLQAGGGVEMRLDEQYALTSSVLVNLLPGEVLGEGAFLSWQIVQLSFRF